MTDKMFMEVQDVTEMLNVSEGKAYEIIRMLNAELKEKGYIVVRGKVNTKYFFKKLIYNEEQEKKMSVYKDEKRNSWYVKFRYVDQYGVKKQTTKRGFATKREASEWENAEKLKRNFNLDMTFSKFYEIYEADVRHRVKETTWENKETNLHI